jgi:L-serine dehydratase
MNGLPAYCCGLLRPAWRKKMRFKDVFSIIGPAMIGPSSSHTAGAARIGRFVRQLYGEVPHEVLIQFFGSFAATYKGHGTDVAMAGGLLDWNTDDARIPKSLETAESLGMKITFEQGKGLFPHPNTARLKLSSVNAGEGKRSLSLTGISIGGGNIEITEIDGFSTKISGMYPTLVIRHLDWTGVIANVTAVMKRHTMNIGYMSVDRKGRSGDALTVLELDSPLSGELLQDLRHADNVSSVHVVDLTAG